MMMTIKEIYTISIKDGYEELSLLIEFLVFDKNVVGFDDKQDVLDLYFKPNNEARMKKLLLEYKEKLNGD